jgi:transposase
MPVTDKTLPENSKENLDRKLDHAVEETFPTSAPVSVQVTKGGVIVRTGWYREARVKSFAAHAVRHFVGARAQLKGMSVDLSNQIRSILKTFGLMAGKGAGHTFAIRVRELLEGRPSRAAIVDPLLAAWRAVREQIAVLDRRLIRLAKEDPTCRPLMTCPGVGVIVATSCAASIEALEHFRRSCSVGAYLGLTPARHQSGKTDRRHLPARGPADAN